MISTPRLAAIGTLCRRPSALLIPLAPLVLVVFVGALVACAARSAITGSVLGRRAAAAEQVETDATEAAVPTTRLGRAIAAVRVSPKAALGGAAALMAGILLAASTAGGTFAFLNSQQKPASAITINSGSLAVTVQAVGTTAGATTAIPTAAWTNMLPGDFAGQTITISNTGTVNTDVTARLSATTPWDIRLYVGACPTTQLTSATLTTSAVYYGTLAAGTSATVCLQATLPTTAAASVEATSSNFTITFDAKQVTS